VLGKVASPITFNVPLTSNLLEVGDWPIPTLPDELTKNPLEPSNTWNVVVGEVVPIPTLLLTLSTKSVLVSTVRFPDTDKVVALNDVIEIELASFSEVTEASFNDSVVICVLAMLLLVFSGI
jgi:hypothetical protein